MDEETSSETTSLLHSRSPSSSTRGRDGPSSSRARKYDAIKLPPPDDTPPRLFIAQGHVLLTLAVSLFIGLFIGLTLSSGLPILDQKWQAFDEQQM